MPALEYSVNPYLVSSDRNVASGREPAAQRAGKPDLLRFTGSVNHRCETGGGRQFSGRPARVSSTSSRTLLRLATIHIRDP
jgi:hypothetical protein